MPKHAQSAFFAYYPIITDKGLKLRDGEPAQLARCNSSSSDRPVFFLVLEADVFTQHNCLIDEVDAISTGTRRT